MKKPSIPLSSNLSDASSHLVAGGLAKIAKRGTLSAASSSAINKAATKSALKSKIGMIKGGSLPVPRGKATQPTSTSLPPKSSIQALKPKTATASVPKQQYTKSDSIGHRGTSNRQRFTSEPNSSSCSSNVPDMNKSLSLAQEMISIQKEREAQLGTQLETLQSDKIALEQARNKLQETVLELEKSSHVMALKINEMEHLAELKEGKQAHENELHIRDLQHEHETTVNKLENKWKSDMEVALEQARREGLEMVQNEKKAMQKMLAEKEQTFSEKLEKERAAMESTIEHLKAFHNQKQTSFKLENDQLRREVKRLENDNSDLKHKLENLNSEVTVTKSTLNKLQSEAEDNFYNYKVQIRNLEADLKSRTNTIKSLEVDLETTQFEGKNSRDKLFQAETMRRKLHEQIQELKGNIRVFCRVRPLLPNENLPVELDFPDENEEGQQLKLTTQNISGMPSDAESPNKIHNFAFDRVFGPQSRNEQIFEEVSQLVQSALDGYNVCIFAYGQTGSGKTFTMSSTTNGIIPLALNQIFETAESLKEVGWEYTYHGEFLEIYNEKIIDLLKSDDTGDRKYEIRHDTAKSSTTVLGLTSVPLNNPAQAVSVLDRASRNRSVAATMANERSSRSHSVFILRFTGNNAVTGKSCSGVLNLIDLAGSERLSHSQVTGDRLKETQAINKSLSSLGDVIGALGSKNKDAHIPYRNSKVSYSTALRLE